MKIFFSEYTADAKNYRYPYQVYAIQEKSDTLEDMYSLGFLPSRSKEKLFYLARGVRVNLGKFSLSSENRRIERKTQYLCRQVHSLDNFSYHYAIGKLAKDFYENRFEKKIMSAFRIKWLCTAGSATHILEYRDANSDEIIGYCIGYASDTLLHYAYPFYDLEYYEKGAGIGMMLSAITWAKDQGMEFVYLGTCYTPESLYKLQFKGMEYFTGYRWSSDIDRLKDLVRGAQQSGHMLDHVEDKDLVFKTYGMKYQKQKSAT